MRQSCDCCIIEFDVSDSSMLAPRDRNEPRFQIDVFPKKVVLFSLSHSSVQSEVQLWDMVREALIYDFSELSLFFRQKVTDHCIILPPRPLQTRRICRDLAILNRDPKGQGQHRTVPIKR